MRQAAAARGGQPDPRLGDDVFDRGRHPALRYPARVGRQAAARGTRPAGRDLRRAEPGGGARGGGGGGGPPRGGSPNRGGGPPPPARGGRAAGGGGADRRGRGP